MDDAASTKIEYPMNGKFRYSLALAIVASAANQSAAQDAAPSRLGDAVRFRQISIFSIGLVGFAGHISQEQLLFERLMAVNKAETGFSDVIADPQATSASKLYSLCGLKRLNSSRFKPAYDVLKKVIAPVGVMTADIMTSEKTSSIADRIDRNGC